MSFSGWQLRAARHLLGRDGIIAYPTEAVYGLGCEPRSYPAVSRLLQLKGRPAAKGLILVAAARDQLDPYVEWDALERGRRETLLSTWPGPVTWLLPARRGTPAWLCGAHDVVAARVTAHAPTQQLCLAYGGALISTSANRTGMRPARSALAVQRIFGDALDLILHGPLGGLDRPTAIRDGQTGAIVRPG